MTPTQLVILLMRLQAAGVISHLRIYRRFITDPQGNTHIIQVSETAWSD